MNEPMSSTGHLLLIKADQYSGQRMDGARKINRRRINEALFFFIPLSGRICREGAKSNLMKGGGEENIALPDMETRRGVCE
jgi:hypothetical protein